MHDYGVSHFQAVSTSAMREAANQEILVERNLRGGVPPQWEQF